MATSPLPRRKRGTSPLILPLAALVLAAVGGAIWYFTRGEPARPAAPVRPAGTVAVPVAVRALPKGTEMEGPGLIRPMYLRPEQVPPDAILQPNSLLNRVTQVSLRPGEYFSESKLAPVGAPNGFSGLLRPGFRMVVMNAAALGGVSRFLREGDVVDIVATSGGAPGGRNRNNTNLVATGNSLQPGTAAPSVRNAQANAANAATEQGLALVAQAVRVVIAPPPPPRQQQRNRRAPPPSQEMALEVHEDDAPTLQLAMVSGRVLQVVHRPFNDVERVDPTEARLARMPRDPRVIEIIEGGGRRTVAASYDE